jgi:hypothetical protein
MTQLRPHEVLVHGGVRPWFKDAAAAVSPIHCLMRMIEVFCLTFTLSFDIHELCCWLCSLPASPFPLFAL